MMKNNIEKNTRQENKQNKSRFSIRQILDRIKPLKAILSSSNPKKLSLENYINKSKLSYDKLEALNLSFMAENIYDIKFKSVNQKLSSFTKEKLFALIKQFTPMEIKILNILLLTLNNNKFCYRSQTKIARILGCARRTVIRAYQHFVVLGLIESHYRGVKRTCLVTIAPIFYTFEIRNLLAPIFSAFRFLPLLMLLVTQDVFSFKLVNKNSRELRRYTNESVAKSTSVERERMKNSPKRDTPKPINLDSIPISRNDLVKPSNLSDLIANSSRYLQGFYQKESILSEKEKEFSKNLAKGLALFGGTLPQRKDHPQDQQLEIKTPENPHLSKLKKELYQFKLKYLPFEDIRYQQLYDKIYAYIIHAEQTKKFNHEEIHQFCQFLANINSS